MCDAVLSPRILISGADGKMSNYVRAVRAAGGTPVSGYCPHRTCPAPGCCCAAAATWTPSCTDSPTRAPSPRTPPGTRQSWSCSAPFIRRAALSWGSAEACRSLMWLWGAPCFRTWGTSGVPPIPTPQADQVHPVRAQPGSLLHTLYGPRFSVNSSHHQAVDCPAPGLVLTLRAVDGVPEAIEHPSLPILGVQFHPGG